MERQCPARKLASKVSIIGGVALTLISPVCPP
jgi:hypothetical protein